MKPFLISFLTALDCISENSNNNRWYVGAVLKRLSTFNIHHFHYVNWLKKLPLIRSDETFDDLSRETVDVALMIAVAVELIEVFIS